MEHIILLITAIIIVILAIMLITNKQFNKRKNEKCILNYSVYADKTKETSNIRIDKIQSVKLYDINTGEMISEFNEIREVSVK